MNDALQKYALRGDQRHQVFARGRNSEEIWCQEKQHVKKSRLGSATLIQGDLDQRRPLATVTVKRL